MIKCDHWKRFMKLVITVIDIKGTCPVYQVGHRITLREGYILDPAASDAACMHSLASILPYYVALSHGLKARNLGLARRDADPAHVQCLDPCHLTGGGTVVFEITVIGNH